MPKVGALNTKEKKKLIGNNQQGPDSSTKEITKQEDAIDDIKLREGTLNDIEDKWKILETNIQIKMGCTR